MHKRILIFMLLILSISISGCSGLNKDIDNNSAINDDIQGVYSYNGNIFPDFIPSAEHYIFIDNTSNEKLLYWGIKGFLVDINGNTFLEDVINALLKKSAFIK